MKAVEKYSIIELVNSLKHANTENIIESITTENDSNNLIGNSNDRVDTMENAEFEHLNTSTIEFPSQDIYSVEDNEFEELSEQTENFEQNIIDMEDMRNLHPNTNCTVLDAHCMIYAFFIRHKITWTAVHDLLLLCNRIIGNNVLQPSVHHFKKKNTENFEL